MKENFLEDSKKLIKEKILRAIDNAPDWDLLQLKSINVKNEQTL